MADKGTKQRRTSKKAGAYQAYRRKSDFKKLRKKADRARRIKAAEGKTKKLSPSDRRRKLLRAVKFGHSTQP